MIGADLRQRMAAKGRSRSSDTIQLTKQIPSKKQTPQGEPP